jgi:hypothetical protein
MMPFPRALSAHRATVWLPLSALRNPPTASAFQLRTTTCQHSSELSAHLRPRRLPLRPSRSVSTTPWTSSCSRANNSQTPLGIVRRACHHSQVMSVHPSPTKPPLLHLPPQSAVFCYCMHYDNTDEYEPDEPYVSAYVPDTLCTRHGVCQPADRHHHSQER